MRASRTRPQNRFFTNPIVDGSGPSRASASAIIFRSWSLTPLSDLRSAAMFAIASAPAVVDPRSIETAVDAVARALFRSP